MNAFELSRNWFDWSAKQEAGIVSAYHATAYFYLIDQNNRMRWKEVFGVSTKLAMRAVGVTTTGKFWSVINELVEWNFILLVQKSKNQHQYNRFSLVKNPSFSQAVPKRFTGGQKKSAQASDGVADISAQAFHEGAEQNLLYVLKHNTKTSVHTNTKITSGDQTPEAPKITSQKAPRKKKEFVPPSEEEFVNFWKENGYSETRASSVWKTYSENLWFDSHGNKISNWKMKCRFVWFKPDNLSGKPILHKAKIGTKPILTDAIDFNTENS